ncbi:heterokaryon incompatibility protein-domain-containing protein [Camillea tinctor]|nr:heterokaryon incompatibility protein-domain-containing protein [Camillea tinctor]
MEFDADMPLYLLDRWPRRATKGRLLHEVEKAQEIMKPESSFREWCEHLRFVIDVRPEKLDHDFELIESANERESREPYIAISYRWPSEGSFSSNYILAPVPDRPGVKAVRPIRAHIDVLDRCFAFAAAKGIRKIWIDQECIHQDNDKDKQCGLQTMHLVYRWSALTLVILGRHVKSLCDIRALQHLTIPEDQGQNTVRGRIKEDEWWERAWTTQELGLSNAGQLRYLIAWDQGLDLSGTEWEMSARKYNSNKSEDAHQNVSRQWVLVGGEMFGIAHMMPYSPGITQTLTAGLASGTRGMGNTFTLTRPPAEIDFPSQEAPCDEEIRGVSIAEAMTMLYLKKCLYESDKLAIIGNLANFSQRIDTKEAERRHLGFSACALALAWYNGDISIMFTWMQSKLKEDVTFAERAVRPLATWMPDQRMNLNHIASAPSSIAQKLQTRSFHGPRTLVIDGKLAVEGILWDISPYHSLGVIRDQMASSKDTTSRLQLLARSLFELERPDILEALIVIAMQRQFKSLREFSSIIEQLHGWFSGSGDWPTVFSECNLLTSRADPEDANPGYSENIMKICENISQGQPMFIGQSYVGQEMVTCICSDKVTKAFSPRNSLDYEFGVNDWLHLEQDSRHWPVESCRDKVPQRIVERLRERLEDQRPLSDVIFQVRGTVAITPTPRLSSAGLFTDTSFTPINLGKLSINFSVRYLSDKLTF